MPITEHTSKTPHQSPNTQPHAPPDPPSRPMFESRRLTLNACALTTRWDPYDESAPPSNSRPIAAPCLRLAGKWLEKAGFAIGAKVRVDVSQGRLVIEPLPQLPDRTPRPPRRGKKVFP